MIKSMILFSEPVMPFNWLCEGKEFQIINRLKSKWDQLHEETGVFRYKINNLQEKQLKDWLVQLNPERGTNRRQPEEIESLIQPFNRDKFNFTKASLKEVLFYLKRDSDDSDLHAILINVSPINRYHSLLCPSINECLPQVVTKSSIQLALELMLVAQDRDLKIGINSLCAHASVNHLHYHIFLESHTLPVETEKCTHIKNNLFWLAHYPALVFCFELKSLDLVPEISNDIYKIIEHLINKSIAHNMLITRGRSVQGDEEVIRILVFPRKNSSGAKKMSAFNVAVCELSGWFPVHNKEAYANLTTEDLENELRKWTVENFTELVEEVKLFI